MIRIDILGQRFGRHTVIGCLKERVKKKVMWLCLCDCGVSHVVDGRSLRSGISKSCGCLRSEIIRSLHKGRPPTTRLASGEASFNHLYDQYIRGATARGWEFFLTKEQFKLLTSATCFYCGSRPFQKIHHGRAYGPYLYNGIDRINNTQGYTMGNCISCCGVCNRMKSNMEQKEFYTHVLKIAHKYPWYKADPDAVPAGEKTVSAPTPPSKVK
jgi:hypothetical protein